MTTDPQQQQMIREAMKAIAERRPGRSKLVYDKTKRTIVAVSEGSQTPIKIQTGIEHRNCKTRHNLTQAAIVYVKKYDGGKPSGPQSLSSSEPQH